MEIKIVIGDNLVESARRVFSKRRLMALAMFIALGSAVAWAAPLGSVPNSFNDGDVISASQMNENFQAVVDAVDNKSLFLQGAACDNALNCSCPDGLGLVSGGAECPVGTTLRVARIEGDAQSFSASCNDSTTPVNIRLICARLD